MIVATYKCIYTLAKQLIGKNWTDGLQTELVDPPAAAAVGEPVTFPGYSNEPKNILSAKSKVWEKVQADLHTDPALVACYRDAPFTTSAGVCKVATIANGVIT